MSKYTNLFKVKSKLEGYLFKAESKIWVFLFIKESSLNLIDLKIEKGCSWGRANLFEII